MRRIAMFEHELYNSCMTSKQKPFENSEDWIDRRPTTCSNSLSQY
jgi:hypothetical protein